MRRLNRSRREMTGNAWMPRLRRPFIAEVTRVSLQLDGIEVGQRDMEAVMRPGAASRELGPRQSVRFRAHVAILRRIERIARRREPLTPAEVVRWQTSLACGLPLAMPNALAMTRLGHICFRLSTPHRQIPQALDEAAALYLDLLNDPLVPSFNGILARLLLFCQLGRSKLPPIRFDLQRDRRPPDDVESFVRRLQDLVLDAVELLSVTEPAT